MRTAIRLWRNLPLKAKVGVVLFGVFVLAAIIGPQVLPYDPSHNNPDPALSMGHPSAQHLLGTTQTGQDVLSQLLVGIRLTHRAGAAGRGDRHRPGGDRRRHLRLPRRRMGRVPLPGQQRVPGHSRRCRC